MNGFRRRPSIRTRLALIYTGLLAAALIAFGGGVYLVLRLELEQAFESSLVANADHAADAIGHNVTAAGGFQPSDRLVTEFALTGGRVVVLDKSGRTLLDSAPASSSSLPITATDLASADVNADAVREISSNGARLRMTVQPVLATDGTIVGYVAWAESTESLQALLATVSAVLIVGGLIVVAGALVGGLILARRALAPVADVTETARAISLSGDFAARVEVGQQGDEVGELAIAFNEMLVALEENHQTLQRFLGDASHELRTPLTTIRANLDLARRRGIPEDERRAILADASAEAERMGRLISDLLSLARAEAGVRLESRPVELDALLVETVRHQALASPGLHVAVTSVEPAIVEGDRDRLRELIGILLDNATRYTPEGGAVSASLALREGRAVITIEDTGIGIRLDERERVFERLYRGSRARELRPAGTGLGLAIARWIVEAHGGTIGLEDRPAGGTVAFVSFPARAT